VSETAAGAESELARQLIEASWVPAEDQTIISDALAERIEKNMSRSTLVVGYNDIAEGVETVLSELWGWRYDTDQVSELTIESMREFLGGLCKRLHLPYPICPAPDQ
jgi:hypothetical protein